MTSGSRRVEDHPPIYGDFEGTIRRGNMAAVTVAALGPRLWNRRSGAGYKQGDLKFTLHGNKLHGSWCWSVCATTAPGEKGPNWLLIKHRDEFAKKATPTNILDADRIRGVGAGRLDRSRRQRQGTKTFMTAKSGRGEADRGLAFEPGDAAEARAEKKTEKTETSAPAAKGKKVAARSGFRSAAALHAGRSSP